jgi:L-fuconolactonase
MSITHSGGQRSARTVVCDAQVHVPAVEAMPERANPPEHFVGSLGRSALEREMRAAAVDRAVLVPIRPDRFEECTAWASEEPDRYAVVAPLGVDVMTAPYTNVLRHIVQLQRLGATALRVGFFSAESLAVLKSAQMDDCWRAIAAVGLPVMVLPAGGLDLMDGVIRQYPQMRICLDHMGIVPRDKYMSFDGLLSELLPLSQYHNVGVKLTQIIRSVDEAFPYPSLHQPIRRVVEAFGPSRTFWGSDLTTLQCPYQDCIELARIALGSLNPEEMDQVMGNAVCDWLGWER